MPAFTVTTALLNPATMLTAGTKYVVQNQSGTPVRFRRAAAAFTAADADSLLLGAAGARSYDIPSHLEYTYAAADHIRLWTEEGTATVVFHALE